MYSRASCPKLSSVRSTSSRNISTCEWGSTEAYATAQAEFLRQKYSGRNVRVIVAEAFAALQFTLKFRDRMLPGVPVVHIAVPIDQLERVSLPADVVGKSIDLDPTETLRFALRLQPGAERMVIVTRRLLRVTAFGSSGCARRWRSWKSTPRSSTSPGCRPRPSCNGLVHCPRIRSSSRQAISSTAPVTWQRRARRSNSSRQRPQRRSTGRSIRS